MEFIPLTDLLQLQPGDIVRHKLHVHSFVVSANYGDRATAVQTVDITNCCEWEVLRKEPIYSHRDFVKEEALLISSKN